MLRPQEDALGFIKSHPDMWFPDGKPHPLKCTHYLVAEILALGALDVSVHRSEEWWSVSSARDWLREDDSYESFRRLIPLPEIGPNASRIEVVIAAFATDVFVIAPEGSTSVIAGRPPDEEAWRALHTSNTRSVWFRFAK
jgi:hypothetical protein